MSYDIDAWGRRVGKRINSTLARQYVWSGDLRIVAELDGSGTVLNRYVYGNKVNVPELVIRGGQTYKVITDQLGSPLLVVNVANPSEVLLRAEYDAWGNVTEYEVSGQPGGTWPIAFGFAGGLYDEDTGLVRFGSRDYDPEVGRWTSKDPILFGGGQANLYVYAYNDPTNFLDPDGEIAFLALIPVGVKVFLGGAVVAGGITASWQYATKGTIDGTDVAVSATFGGLTAGVGGAILGSASSALMRWVTLGVVAGEIGFVEAGVTEAINSAQGQNPDGFTPAEMAQGVGEGVCGEVLEPAVKGLRSAR